MKHLIANNFLYYLKNRTKIMLSITFVFSFFIMLYVYDRLELDTIKEESRNVYIEYTLDFDAINTMENPEAFEELIRRFIIIEEDYHYSLSGGRMNFELTPFRLELASLKRQLLELNDPAVLSFDNQSYEDVLLEEEKYMQLQDLMVADDFNQYTVTASNLSSKLFEGYFLFMSLIFVVILFYDIFSKDFDSKTYRTLFTTSYPRKKIIQARIIFAILYFISLIAIALILLSLYLLVIKRTGYNVIPSRIGTILHPRIVNINPFTFATGNKHLVLISTWIYNLLSIILGFSFLALWITLVSFISFKVMSSNNTLIIMTYTLLALFVINGSELRKILIYIIPLTAFDYHSSLSGENLVNGFYLLIITILYLLIILKLLNKNLNTMDLLDGNHND